MLNAYVTSNQENAFLTEPCVITRHEDLIALLLDRVKTVDFFREVNQSGSKSVKRKHIEVIVVEEILRLARLHHWGLCRKNGNVYLFNGAYWKPFDDEALKRFLGEAAERMGVEALEAKHHDFRKSLMLQFAATASLPAPIERDTTVKINLQNGTLEIGHNEIKLREFRAKDFITYQLPFAYDPNATCPMFDRFLNRVLPDSDCQKVLAEFIGYIFIKNGILKLEKALLLYGTGANGKSVLFEVLSAMLGSENISNYSLHNLASKTNEYYRAMIEDKLVNYGTEINGSLDAGLFKQLASGEPVECRPIYGKPYTITDYAKLIFNCNELPHEVEHTTGFFRRFIIIPFGVTIPEQERDAELSIKISQQELSGVLNWALSGLKRLLDQKRFTDSKAVKQQIDLFRIESDSVESYLYDAGYKPDMNRFEPLDGIYSSYRASATSDGKRPVNKANFRKRIEAIGYQTTRRSSGHVVFAKQVKSD